MKRDSILEALQNRRSIKLFNDRKIRKDDLNTILEAGRLSPSSYGFEHWKFIVVENQDLKDRLSPVCYNQPQVASCSHLIVVLARLDFGKDSAYLEKCLRRFGSNYDSMRKIVYSSVCKMDENTIKEWSSKQTYIAGANMMTTASYIGVDSCPMEGFDPEGVHKELGLSSDFSVSLIIPFGYRAKEPHPQVRYDIDDLVEYR